MADTFQFELVSPERRLTSVAATRVQIPGSEGEFTAMPRHAPFLTTLRPGIVAVTAEGQTTEYLVTGGFAEVSPEAASVLAERAMPREEAGADLLGELEAEAKAALDSAAEDGRTLAAQRLRDVQALRTRLRA
jgi:F-type H+-transporting ATPase subunit epsilon